MTTAIVAASAIQDSASDDRAELMRLRFLEGLSIRAIAKRLNCSRKTVRKHLGTGELPVAAPQAPRASLLDSYDKLIQEWLADTRELKTPQLLERLRPHGYSGGVSILRDRLRKLRPLPEAKAFLTVNYTPGEVMQVDWADFGFALPGIPRRVSAFVAMLGHSRLLYVEFSLSQAMGTFLRAMDRALAFCGGTATADVFDNMKTVVLEHRAGLRP